MEIMKSKENMIAFTKNTVNELLGELSSLSERPSFELRNEYLEVIKRKEEFIKALTDENTSLKVKIAELESEIQSIKLELEKSKAQYEEKIKIIEETKEGEKSELIKKINEMSGVIENLKSKLEALEKLSGELDNRVLHLNQENSRLKSENENLKKTHEAERQAWMEIFNREKELWEKKHKEILEESSMLLKAKLEFYKEVEPKKETFRIEVEKEKMKILPLLIPVLLTIVSIVTYFFIKADIYELSIENPSSIAFNGRNLIVSNWIDGSIYGLNLKDPLKIEYRHNLQDIKPSQIYEDKSGVMFILDVMDKKIYEFKNLNLTNEYDTSNRTIISFTYGDGYLWLLDGNENKIIRLDITGSGDEKIYELPFEANSIYYYKNIYVLSGNYIYEFDVSALKLKDKFYLYKNAKEGSKATSFCVVKERFYVLSSRSLTITEYKAINRYIKI